MSAARRSRRGEAGVEAQRVEHRRGERGRRGFEGVHPAAPRRGAPRRAPRHAELHPLGDRPRLVRPLQRAVEALRQLHLVAPGLPAIPALRFERVGGRGERVRDRVPDVALPVAVEVDGELLEVFRHELRVAHSTCPGALELSARGVALLDDLERGDQLRAELVRATPHEGLRGDRADGVVWAIDLAEARLASPDGDDDACRHAILLLDGDERRPVLRDLGAPRRRERVERPLFEIKRRRVEFGLMLRRHGLDERRRQRRSVRGRRIWQHEMRQRPVELQPLEIGVEGCARYAGSFGIGPKRLQPCSEALLDGTAIGGDLRVVGGRNGERRKRHYRQ